MLFGNKNIGKINFHKSKFLKTNLSKVYITHPCPILSKMILVTAIDNRLKVNNSLTNYNDVLLID